MSFGFPSTVGTCLTFPSIHQIHQVYPAYSISSTWKSRRLGYSSLRSIGAFKVADEHALTSEKQEKQHQVDPLGSCIGLGRTGLSQAHPAKVLMMYLAIE